MINLRLLQINHVHLPQGLDYLSNELCFMNWEKYPLESLPESFHPNKLIELIMRASSLKQIWKGIKVRFSLMQQCAFFFFLKINIMFKMF